MDNNDTISRKAILKRKCKYYVYDETGCCCEEYAVPVEEIKKISPVNRNNNLSEEEMTNREYLESLSNEDLVNYLLSDEFVALKMSFTSSSSGLISWLDEKRINNIIIK